jgi:DNA topoisomerase-1
VDSGDINQYLRAITGQEFTAKDFRTWAGTMYAATALREMGPAATRKQQRANVNAAVDLVAERLGNTRSVCRKYYVHPRVIGAYEQGIVAPTPPRASTTRRPRRRGQLRKDEVAVLSLLTGDARSAGARPRRRT